LAIFAEKRKCSSKPVILHFSTARTSLVGLCRKGAGKTTNPGLRILSLSPQKIGYKGLQIYKYGDTDDDLRRAF
jgi:hypothetical protein